MSLKVVLGNVDRVAIDQQSLTKDAGKASGAAQSAISRAIQTSDAVVSTLKAFRSNGSRSGESVKDVRQAEKLAEDISEKIRENPEEAKSAHDGLTSDRGASALSS